MTTTLISLGAVNIEAADPAALGQFWADVTGGILTTSGGTAFLAAAGPGGFAMFFHPGVGPGPNGNRIHLDLTVPWGSREGEVDRLASIGASKRWEVLGEEPHVQWTTMADPEGNLFCVAEHPPVAAPITGDSGVESHKRSADGGQ